MDIKTALKHRDKLNEAAREFNAVVLEANKAGIDVTLKIENAMCETETEAWDYPSVVSYASLDLENTD